MNAPIISICIPTKNRCDLLQQSLEVLSREIVGLGVEVCVSDNASTDSTADMMAKWSESCTWLRFQRQSHDVGIDGNMEAVARMARGRFIWQLGDDDLVAEGAMGYLVNEVTVKAPDLLILQGRITDGRQNKLAEHIPGEMEGREYPDVRSAFRDLWHRMKYGSFIIPREACEGSWARYRNTCHAYTGVVWDYLVDQESRGRGVRISCGTRNSVVLREVPKTYATYRCRVLCQDIPLWISLLPDYISEEKKWLMRRWLKSQSSWRSICRHVRSGQLTGSNCEEIMASFSRWQRAKAKFMAVLLRFFFLTKSHAD